MSAYDDCNSIADLTAAVAAQPKLGEVSWSDAVGAFNHPGAVELNNHGVLHGLVLSKNRGADKDLLAAIVRVTK